jgi:hypothetical protein
MIAAVWDWVTSDPARLMASALVILIGIAFIIGDQIDKRR